MAAGHCLPAAAYVQQVPQISIPATTLDRALIALARQASIDLGSTERGLSAVRTGTVVGRMPAREALERLLAGTDYRAIAIDARSFRVVRALRVRAMPRPRPAPLPTTAGSPGIPSLLFRMLARSAASRRPSQ